MLALKISVFSISEFCFSNITLIKFTFKGERFKKIRFISSLYVPSVWPKNVQVFKLQRTFRKQQRNKDELSDTSQFSAK